MTRGHARPAQVSPERDWILVGTDLSRSGMRALEEAARVARQRNAELLMLHVIEDEGLAEAAQVCGLPEAELRERIEKARRQRLEEEVRVEGRLLIAWGHPFEQILRKAREFAVDLIVLGTAGRTADLQRALFGSTAEKVLRAAPCPVLCVPPMPGEPARE